MATKKTAVAPAKKTTTKSRTEASLDASATMRVIADHGRAIQGVSCTRDGRILTAGFGRGEGRQVRLFGASGEELGQFGPSGGSVCWYAEASPDGDTVVAGFGSLQLGWWTPRTGDTEFMPTPYGIVAAVSWTRDGSTVFAGCCGDKTVRVLDVASRAIRAQGSTKKSTAWFVAAHPDGHEGVSGYADGVVYVWRLADGSLLRTLAGHGGKILGLRYAPDGARLASASQDKTVRIWSVRSGESLACSGHRKQVTCVAWWPDGSRVVSTSGDGTLRVWRASDATLLATVTLPGTKADAVAVAADGEILAGCQDGKLRGVRLA